MKEPTTEAEEKILHDIRRSDPQRYLKMSRDGCTKIRIVKTLISVVISHGWTLASLAERSKI